MAAQPSPAEKAWLQSVPVPSRKQAQAGPSPPGPSRLGSWAGFLSAPRHPWRPLGISGHPPPPVPSSHFSLGSDPSPGILHSRRSLGHLLRQPPIAAQGAPQLSPEVSEIKQGCKRVGGPGSEQGHVTLLRPQTVPDGSKQCHLKARYVTEKTNREEGWGSVGGWERGGWGK